MPETSFHALNNSPLKELLAQPVIAHLATSNPRTSQPHVVPVWFHWDGSSLYISAFSSTRKVREVKRNKKVSILIETEKAARAVLLEGTAEVITDPRQVHDLSIAVYSRYAPPEGLSEDMKSWADDPENTIIKLTPAKIFAWG